MFVPVLKGLETTAKKPAEIIMILLFLFKKIKLKLKWRKQNGELLLFYFLLKEKKLEEMATIYIEEAKR
jgi:hypothetical protein